MSGETILVVDDNTVNLKLAWAVLKKRNYEVYTAEDAIEALAVLKTIQPDLILMDIQLPGMDGLELTRLLKSQPATRDIIIVALTAYAMKGDEQKAKEAGCDGYITKPISARTLIQSLSPFLVGTKSGTQQSSGL